MVSQLWNKSTSMFSFQSHLIGIILSASQIPGVHLAQWNSNYGMWIQHKQKKVCSLCLIGQICSYCLK